MRAMTTASTRKIQLEPSWLEVLQDEFEKPYMQALRAFLRKELRRFTVYPPGPEMFNALNTTPFKNVRVVILGQDPYHGKKQAHGLCFSVRRGVRIPPSLENIYRELHDDVGLSAPNHGDLTAWAEQGVLLLNTVLSVRAGKPHSHKGQGWERFTDQVIQVLNTQREGLVFVLWGAAARKKAGMIDRQRHLIVHSSHPSPYSADRGFFGSRPFSRINTYLTQRGEAPIDWTLAA